MIPFADLWLPIVLSAVAVFLVSSILHMVLKYHRADYKRIPNEQEALAGLQKAALSPGLYQFPYCESMKEMSTPEGIEKFRRGPVGILGLYPNQPMAIGKFLGLWFVYTLLVSGFIGCLAGQVLAVGAEGRAVFHFTAIAAFLAYGVTPIVDSIWRGVPWMNTVRAIIDGLLYALATGGIFCWLWPGRI